MKKIGISTDCMCDLPADYLAANGIDVMQFYIHTATGRFRNESEITSENILEYLEGGNAIVKSNVPEPEECKAYFEEILTRYDEVIHITTRDQIGLSHPNAKAGLKLMGENAERVALINSGSISTGLGHMVLLAVSLRDSGKSVAEIIDACDAMRGKIASSFIVPNADYLQRMGYASGGVKMLCNLLNIHPVLCTKNGKLTVKTFRVGNYEKAIMRYIRSEFKHSEGIDKRQLFITHAGCPVKILSWITTQVPTMCNFEKVTVTRASDVISSCCGPETVGVLYVYE